MTKTNDFKRLLVLGICLLSGCASSQLGGSDQSLETIPETMATSAKALADQEQTLASGENQPVAEASGFENLSQTSFGEVPNPDPATIAPASYQQQIAPTQSSAQVASNPTQASGGQRWNGGGAGFPDQRGQAGFGQQGRPHSGRPGFGGQRPPGIPGGFRPNGRVNANLFMPGLAPPMVGSGFSQATMVQQSVPANGFPNQTSTGVSPMVQEPPPMIPPNDPRGRIPKVTGANYNPYAPGAVSLYGDQLRQPQMSANEVSLKLQAFNQQHIAEIHDLQEQLKALQEKYDAEHELRIETDQKLASANQLNAELKRMVVQLETQNERLAREKADIKRKADDALRQIESNLDSVIMNSLSKSIKQ